MARLALLICDELAAADGGYGPVFDRLLSASLARTAHGAETAFTLDRFDVVRDAAYPPHDVPYDGVLITGSRASAYQDTGWINTLVAYVRHILTATPSVKVFGICFGHQIVARALGGSCVQNNSGVWEVAVTAVRLTPLGKAIFGPDDLHLQQMHRDHVPTPPPAAHILGYTDVTPNHGMAIFDASSPPPLDAPVDLTSIHVLTVQGHPEFTEHIMSSILDARLAVLGQDLVRDGRLRAGGIPGTPRPDGLACDGVGRVGRAIWGVLGVV